MFKAHSFVPGSIVETGTADGELDDEVGREVTALFAAERRRRGGKLFDGLLFSVERLEEQQIVGRFVRYSLFVAQLARPELFDILRVRPLGVSGLLTCADGVVFGQRDDLVTQDAGLWELVPAGGIDPSSRDETGRIDVVSQILKEMCEEIGVGREQADSALPFGMIENLDNHVIDIAIEIKTVLDGQKIRWLFRHRGNGEYTELMLVPPAEVPGFVERCGGELTEISRFLLQERGLA